MCKYCGLTKVAAMHSKDGMRLPVKEVKEEVKEVQEKQPQPRLTLVREEGFWILTLDDVVIAEKKSFKEVVKVMKACAEKYWS